MKGGQKIVELESSAATVSDFAGTDEIGGRAFEASEIVLGVSSPRVRRFGGGDKWSPAN